MLCAIYFELGKPFSVGSTCSACPNLANKWLTQNLLSTVLFTNNEKFLNVGLFVLPLPYSMYGFLTCYKAISNNLGFHYQLGYIWIHTKSSSHEIY